MRLEVNNQFVKILTEAKHSELLEMLELLEKEIRLSEESIKDGMEADE